ncbi:TPA: hypothetical protein ACKMOK_001674, partial [Neisseria gonorrhoeae]
MPSPIPAKQTACPAVTGSRPVFRISRTPIQNDLSDGICTARRVSSKNIMSQALPYRPDIDTLRAAAV